MFTRPMRWFAAAALAASATACSSYLDHNDTVSRSAGDAVAANAAIQTIDPWPAASEKTGILSGGKEIKTAKSAVAPTGDMATPAADQQAP